MLNTETPLESGKGLLESLRNKEYCQYYESFIESLERRVNEGECTWGKLRTSPEELWKLGLHHARIDIAHTLKWLRQGDQYYEQTINKLRKKLVRWKLSLADVGTNEAELARCSKKGAACLARWFWGQLRTNASWYRQDEISIGRELTRAGLRFKNIGTSKTRVKMMANEQAKSDARDCLKDLRRGESKYEEQIKWMREFLAKRKLPLESIGTSEQEIAVLKQKGVKTLIKEARERGFLLDDEEKRIRKTAREGKFSLADIGSNEKEVEELLNSW